MALSGSTNFEPNITEFIEEAYERCGIELRTGYDLKSAIRSANLMLAEWANRGLNQWTIETGTQTVTEGTASYNLGTNVIDILDVVVRRTDGSTTTDINMDRISRSEYFNIPNKATKSRPSQFFLDKQNNPTLFLYPAPENSTDIIRFSKLTRMDDADNARNTMDIPFRFFPCFAAGLAYYISIKKAPQRTAELKAIYEEEFRRAADQDEDRASFKIRPFSRGAY
jgi:hypothetical protein|tara:strand:+ start:1628 stop:2302 length:675 start_codon:yes stop_codon:yes gene_type:complete